MSISYKIIKDPFDKNILTRLNEDGTVTYIPFIEANSDYQAYLKHLTENPTEDE